MKHNMFFLVYIRGMKFIGLFFIMVGLMVFCQSSKGEKEFQQGLEAEKAGYYELALSYFRIAAEQGYARAQNSLGNYYREGLGGLTSDAEEAAKWYRKAAEQGYSGAQMNLARCYYYGSGVPQNIAATFTWNLKAAKNGDLPVAQCGVAILYENGEGTERNMKEAMKWYRKAAKQGDQFAKERLEYLASFDSDGTGKEALAVADTAVVVPAGKKQVVQAGDPEEKRQAFEQAFEKRLVEGVYQKGLEAYNEHNLQLVRKYFIRASELGHKEALTKLAEYYYYEEKNPKEAFKWWLQAAEQGSAEAQFFVGECYVDGDGVGEDLQEALKWYRKAMDQGHEMARISVALYYFMGWGVEQNYAKAADYVRELAKAGNADAQCTYGKCLYQMNAQNTEAKIWIRKSVENGSPAGTYFYGWCLYEGAYGFSQDRQKGIEFIKKAVKMGFEIGQEWLDEHNL